MSPKQNSNSNVVTLWELTDWALPCVPVPLTTTFKTSEGQISSANGRHGPAQFASAEHACALDVHATDDRHSHVSRPEGIDDNLTLRAAFQKFCNSPSCLHDDTMPMQEQSMTFQQFMSVCRELQLLEPQGPVSLATLSTTFMGLKGETDGGVTYGIVLEAVQKLAFDAGVNVVDCLQDKAVATTTKLALQQQVPQTLKPIQSFDRQPMQRRAAERGYEVWPEREQQQQPASEPALLAFGSAPSMAHPSCGPPKFPRSTPNASFRAGREPTFAGWTDKPSSSRKLKCTGMVQRPLHSAGGSVPDLAASCQAVQRDLVQEEGSGLMRRSVSSYTEHALRPSLSITHQHRSEISASPASSHLMSISPGSISASPEQRDRTAALICSWFPPSPPPRSATSCSRPSRQSSKALEDSSGEGPCGDGQHLMGWFGMAGHPPSGSTAADGTAVQVQRDVKAGNRDRSVFANVQACMSAGLDGLFDLWPRGRTGKTPAGCSSGSFVQKGSHWHGRSLRMSVSSPLEQSGQPGRSSNSSTSPQGGLRLALQSKGPLKGSVSSVAERMGSLPAMRTCRASRGPGSSPSLVSALLWDLSTGTWAQRQQGFRQARQPTAQQLSWKSIASKQSKGMQAAGSTCTENLGELAAYRRSDPGPDRPIAALAAALPDAISNE